MDHTKRPTAPEIVDFLATNPRIISPCLDVPLASVQMEHTGQLEMQLTENFRKFSLSWPSNAQTTRSSTSTSSPSEIPSPPLLDINCQDDKQNQDSLLGDATSDLDSTKPLLMNSENSSSVIALQNLQKDEAQAHRYVNIQPGVSVSFDYPGRGRKDAGNIQMEERNAMLPQQRHSEDVSIL